MRNGRHTPPGVVSVAEPRAIQWRDGRLLLLDQTRLPRQRVVLEIAHWREVVRAIREMRVRGAPALGVAAAYALALAARESAAGSVASLRAELEQAAGEIVAARPTAVNVAWAVERLLRAAAAEATAAGVRARLVAEAHRLQEEDEAANRAIGRLGAALLPDDGGVLTHCNTGALATVGYGTALGVIRAAWEAGKRLQVYATETRPFLQGARLTAWELVELGIPVTLLVDGAAAFLMQRRRVQCVVVGADRIAASGDVANKIGTYALALAAREHGVPFYVAAPTSTVDLHLPAGEGVPIEERAPEEVTRVAGVPTAPEGVGVWNPAFDVTPARLVSAIVTERGVLRPPYQEALRRAVAGE